MRLIPGHAAKERQNSNNAAEQKTENAELVDDQREKKKETGKRGFYQGWVWVTWIRPCPDLRKSSIVI